MQTHQGRAPQGRGLSIEGKAVPLHRVLGGFRPYLILGLLVLLVGLPGLTAPIPLDPAEAEFIAASRLMLATGDFVTVGLGDAPPALAPVGVHWLQAAAVEISGASPGALWPYRLPSLLGGLAAVLMVFHFGRRLLGPGVALLAGAFLATAILPAQAWHRATADAVTLACLVAAQGALAQFYMQPRGGQRVGNGTAFTFWLAQGAGVLAAGPLVPFISVATALGLSVADRAMMWLRGLRPIPGVILAAAVTAPWLAAAGATDQPAALWGLLSLPWTAAPAGPPVPGMHAALMPALFWPASLFVLPALVRAFQARRAAAVRFGLAWLLPAWLLFEFLPGVRPSDPLAAYPALALLTALAVLGGEATLRARWSRAYALVWGVGGVGMLAWLAQDTLLTPWAMAMAGIVLLGGVAAPVWLFWRGRFQAAAGLAVAVAALVSAAGPYFGLPLLAGG